MLIFEHLNYFKYELKLSKYWEWKTSKLYALFEIITHYPIADREEKQMIDTIQLRKYLGSSWPRFVLGRDMNSLTYQ